MSQKGKPMGSIRINKITASKFISADYTVKLLPSKTRLGNPWIEPFPINKTELESNDRTFDNFINEYAFYNCNSELGTYPHFYFHMDFTSKDFIDKYLPYAEAMALYQQLEAETKT